MNENGNEQLDVAQGGENLELKQPLPISLKIVAALFVITGSIAPVSYTHLTLPTILRV